MIHFLVKNGATAISKGRLPALGIPSPGPIAIYIIVVNTIAKYLSTLLAKLERPFVFATATTPKIGKTTAVIPNASKLWKVAPPACFPNSGGNIKFPAPKNKPNSIIATLKNCSFVKLFSYKPPKIFL